MKEKLTSWQKFLLAVCGIMVAVAVINILAVVILHRFERPDDAVTGIGAAKGMNGDVTVQVTASQNEIFEVRVLDNNETQGIGTIAIASLPAAIVENQSLQVEAVSSATLTSNAILEGTRLALADAGLDPSVFDVAVKASAKGEDRTIDVDVVILGAGGAGMTAAIEAADAGRSVVVLESTAMVGGNSIRSTGGLNAADTPLQDQNTFAEGSGIEKTLQSAADNYADHERITYLAGVVKEQWEEYQKNPKEGDYFDSAELMELDTLIGGKGINDPDLVAVLSGESADAIAWLESVGAPLSSVSSFGGASVKRIHRPLNEAGQTVSVGTYLVPILEKNLSDRGIEVLLNTTAEQIVLNEAGEAVGVIAKGKTGETITVNAKAIVLATGGFGANLDMVSSYKPELKGFMTTNAVGIQGQGILMAEEAGAALVDMEQIQIHPTVQVDTSALITEGLRGDGAILVNVNGLRFIDEVGTRDVVSAAEIAQPGGTSWLIVDQKMVDASAVIQGYITKNYTVSGEDYAALAKAMGIDVDGFVNTMNKWNSYVADKSDPDFGRTSFASPLDTAPFYGIHVTAGIHHTMGGVAINTETEVLREDGSVIPGLFAAGEVTGGVHGANRLGGNAVADFVVFGRIAGQNAAAYAAEGQSAENAA